MRVEKIDYLPVAVGVDSAAKRRRTLTPWLVPAVTIAVVVASATLYSSVGGATSAAAGGNPTLAPKSAAELLAGLRTTSTTSLFGDINETARWGLPSLPGAADAASLNWQTLLTGSHSASVAVDGPTKQRIAVLGSLTEADVIRNGSDLWTYTSQTNEVTHTSLSAAPGAAPKHGTAENPDAVGAAALSPLAAAQQAITAVTPTTVVSVQAPQFVAKRGTYTLELSPQDTRSTLRKIDIAVDAHTFIPLRVQIYGAGSAPVFETAFSTVHFARPPASTFQFHAPVGATTAVSPFGSTTKRPANHDSRSAAGPQVKTIGTGWTSILEVPASAGSAKMLIPTSGRHSDQRSSAAGLLNSLSVPVGTSGDRLVSTSVVHALITGDGRVFIGAVTAAMLEDAAARNPR